MSEPLLCAVGISKRYGGVVALAPSDIEIFPGEVLALAGSNGAGKTTLVKLLCGAEPADTGTIQIDGEEMHHWDIPEARRRGIEVTHQELALVGQITPIENLYLGREEVFRWISFLAKRRMMGEGKKLLATLGINLANLRAKTSELSGGQQQAVALARTVGWGKRLVTLDEPTAALGIAESAIVHRLVASLRDKGLAVVIVSHRLDQIIELANRVAVVRNGRIVGHLEGDAIRAAALAELITGDVQAKVL